MMVWRRGRAYWADLRERVLSAEGSARSVGQRFGVSVSYVVKARQRRDRTGETTARTARRTRLRRLAGHEQALCAEVSRRVDTTLAELRDWLRAERGVQLGITALWREVKRLGLTLKKSRSTRPSRTARTWRPRAPRGARPRAA
jgi:transposase